MDVANFLTQPVRGNPRTQSITSSTLESSAPCTSLSASPLAIPQAAHSSLAPSTSPGPSGLEQDHDLLPSESPAHGMASPASSQGVDATNKPRRKGPKQRGSRSRGKITKAACESCRAKKAKCDGKRPSCTGCARKGRICSYPVDEGMSAQAAARKRLEMYTSVLSLIRDSETDDCDLIISHLRGFDDLNTAVKRIHQDWLLPPEDQEEDTPPSLGREISS